MSVLSSASRSLGLPAFALVVALTGATLTARAEDLATYAVTLKGHRFVPAEIHVRSGTPFFVIVTNADDAAGEFEMSAPPVEKVIPPGEQGRLRIRPLAPGRFRFFDDFHQGSAEGAFVAE